MNSHAALQLVTPPEQPEIVESLESPFGTIRVKKLRKGPVAFSVTVDGAAPPQAGKEKGQTPKSAGRKKPSAGQPKAPVRKKKAGPVDKARSGNAARHPKTSVPAGSKKDKVLALLKRRQGATLNELMKATCWQAHSVRGFLSGTIAKKMGLTVRSEKRDDGERVYSIRE
jgi:hypothetical protein